MNDARHSALLPAQFDLLVFGHDGNNNRAWIVRNVTPESLPRIEEEFNTAEILLNGMVQLDSKQTHFTDTNILQPTRYVVHVGTNGDWAWLHELPVWNLQKYLEEHASNEGIEHMEHAAEDAFERDILPEDNEPEYEYADEYDNIEDGAAGTYDEGNAIGGDNRSEDV